MVGLESFEISAIGLKVRCSASELQSHYLGRAGWNQTNVDRVKADYSIIELQPQN